ncbi:MAG: shikimate dehydrogenase [Proteobacteria bacterium]|nr:shikimate dehydrogenase [Pseudomonadota bacterium]
MISAKARLAGVMGWPVDHSLSPRLHGYWLTANEIDGAYLPLAVAPEHFAQALRVLALLGFRGVNVTVPHKEAALDAVDVADPLARRIGAVNTITVRDDGSLEGTNTDASGFIEQLKATVPDWRPSVGPAVIIGAGGAARAICVALLDAGVAEIRIVNRTLGRAEALATAVGEPVRVLPWTGRANAVGDAALVVNTTTLGMTGQPALDLEAKSINDDAVVCDIVYAPLQTPLLRAAAVRGLRTVDGLGMLIHQARPGFEAWFGVAPEITDDLRAFLAPDL